MPVVMQVLNTSYIIQSKNEIVKEVFLFCSFEGFRFPGFIKHNKLKFSSALEFEETNQSIRIGRGAWPTRDHGKKRFSPPVF